ncbi:response regulator [Aestuariicoccus sp. MJ-SS9]|uniref:response regulator n=1 Tax=Aestuariicoccus sp. MJ-SS9 TaxID=3079855 RepID=UPI00290A14B2|nr:response regulator [Aestuariicoccus sp. MJ-SS9]MDU8910744.1 response regulator [Aestuariicoccus sp. MJ-SS9]
MKFVGDPGRLRQVLTNLMGNAVKFTAHGHVSVRVVGVVQNGESADIRLTVEDTGIGIPEDKIDHVFGEFNQVEEASNRNFEGTGLGLSITRRLIEMMEGEVWVESKVGQGSCFGFRLRLPVDEPHGADAPCLPPNLTCALVVSEQSANCSILSRQLGLLGAQTTFCSNGAEALGLAVAPPDIVIVEGAVPDMPVADLAQALATSGCAAPMLVLSAEASVLMAQGLPPNVCRVLQKPVARRALFEALEAIVTDRASPTAPPEAAGPQKARLHARLDVLVAEDNKTNQLVFRKMVQHLDLDLRFADNGIEAVAAFRERRPDLVFMDISMPRMDGKEATHEIRRIEGDGPQVPIIAVTAHAMEGDREVIIAAGLTDYLTKPLRKAKILEMIDRYGATLPVADTG